MNRFWAVLLSVGIITTINTPVFAVDVKFSGSYFAAGEYVDKLNVVKNQNNSGSTAFYFQHMQITTEFVAAPGVSLVTRANVMDRVWGGTRSDYVASATHTENQNIGFKYAYINYNSPVGHWLVGYQKNHGWGTTFGDSSTANGKITYILPMDNFKILAAIAKVTDNSFTVDNFKDKCTDADHDEYSIAGIYTGRNWEAGLMYIYYNDNSKRISPQIMIQQNYYKNKFHTLQPYAKAIFGPVAVQAELNYYFGKTEYDTLGYSQDISSLAVFFDVLGNFGRFYVGGTFAYVQGQGDDANKLNIMANGGTDWNPALILWNDDYTSWIDKSATAINKNDAMTNGLLYQIKGGMKPTDKLDIGMAVTFAQADRNIVANQISRDIGWEIDITGVYKLTNNLSYVVGVGYMLPGSFYKEADFGKELTNTYLVINKLILTF